MRVPSVKENQGGKGDFEKSQGMSRKFIKCHGKYYNKSQGKMLVNMNFFKSFSF